VFSVDVRAAKRPITNGIHLSRGLGEGAGDGLEEIGPAPLREARFRLQGKRHSYKGARGRGEGSLSF